MNQLTRSAQEVSRDAKRCVRVLTTDQLDPAQAIPTETREPLAFAILGAATLDGVSANLPRVTGARLRVVLGSITNPGVRAADTRKLTFRVTSPKV
jgi:1,6-anhydro-N-acetylmuramate kinase